MLLTPGQKAHSGEEQIEFGSSEFAVHVLGEFWGAPPLLDLKAEKSLQDLLQVLAAESLVESARDVAEGGIAVAAAKLAFAKGLGVELDLISAGLPAECVLFAEDSSRVCNMRPNKGENNRRDCGKIRIKRAAYWHHHQRKLYHSNRRQTRHRRSGFRVQTELAASTGARAAS